MSRLRRWSGPITFLVSMAVNDIMSDKSMIIDSCRKAWRFIVADEEEPRTPALGDGEGGRVIDLGPDDWENR